MNGALTLYWGHVQEAPNDILILANDMEQALARTFRTAEGIIEHNPELRREAEVQTKTIYLANGTTLTAISGDYAGAAGSNHGLTSWDELWAYTSGIEHPVMGGIDTGSNPLQFDSTRDDLQRLRWRK
jgi:phage terminase large subunit-like protein